MSKNDQNMESSRRYIAVVKMTRPFEIPSMYMLEKYVTEFYTDNTSFLQSIFCEFPTYFEDLAPSFGF